MRGALRSANDQNKERQKANNRVAKTPTKLRRRALGNEDTDDEEDANRGRSSMEAGRRSCDEEILA